MDDPYRVVHFQVQVNLLAPVDELYRRSRIHHHGHPDGVAVPHRVIDEFVEFCLACQRRRRQRQLPGAFVVDVAPDTEQTEVLAARAALARAHQRGRVAAEYRLTGEHRVVTRSQHRLRAVAERDALTQQGPRTPPREPHRGAHRLTDLESVGAQSLAGQRVGR